MINPHYEALKSRLKRHPRTWLVTGCAGFIGSHLIETLLKLNQKVVGLDNFAIGHRGNLSLVRKAVGERTWKRFHFIRGDIRKLSDCYLAFGLKPRHTVLSTKHQKLQVVKQRSKIDIVLHQAALGSVPRSIKYPLSTHEVNVTGFVNMLVAARDAGVKRFVYASSSSVYGDSPILPKREDKTGRQLSPYAVSKYANELYAWVFGRCYGLETMGLRYFNVFGPRQDPNGPYAAVIPRWIVALKGRQPVEIYGDGKTSRDFCYVDNAVQANLLAGLVKNKKAMNHIYNVACGARTTLRQLYSLISDSAPKPRHSAPGSRLRATATSLRNQEKPLPLLRFLPERVGDVRHSLADVSKSRKNLGYQPIFKIKAGIDLTSLYQMAGTI